jgi:DNA invertase Pin-like site-specific DNA recombinase
MPAERVRMSITEPSQRDGIAKAKADGNHKGRKPTVAVQLETIKAMHATGVKPAHIARQLGVARSSVYRRLGMGY